MLNNAKVICPQCGGSHCRPSKWHSHEEKRNYPNSRPYRCPDCSHRFYQRKDSSFNFPLAMALAAAFVAVAIAIVFVIGLPNPDKPIQQYAKVELDDLKLAKKGNPDAQLRVGKTLLHEAAHLGKNSAEAVNWLEKAARNGNTGAMLELGKLYKTGVGALQNFETSARWIQLAANKGNAEGMLELGRMYREGVGFEKDVVRAYVWFNRAAAAQEMNAVRERENIAGTLSFDQLKEAQRLSAIMEMPKNIHTTNLEKGKNLKDKKVDTQETKQSN